MKKHKIEKWWREMCVKKGFDVEKRAEKGRWNLYDGIWKCKRSLGQAIGWV